MILRPSRTRALRLIFWLACSDSWGGSGPVRGGLVAAEKPGVGGDRDADLALDPGTCP